MTGFFRGPSLITHVIALGLAEAIAVPLVVRWSGSFGVAFLTGFVLAFLYVVAALAWGTRGR
jgi:hypothetical protein